VSSGAQKPFYFQPPWNVLFELHRLQKLIPWNVNIAFLLSSFFEEMVKRGDIDFRASGMALDSSATIYLMKSKLLLKLEEPPARPKSAHDFLPPPLFLPLRYELTSTTIKHLLTVLDEVLRGERAFPMEPRLEPLLPPPREFLPPVDLYLVEMGERMKQLYGLLLDLADRGELIGFSKVAAGLGKVEAIRTFIVLLFLAQEGKIGLWQEEDSDEIYITLGGGLNFGETGEETVRAA
jgi:chromatin segregation and condensation protein Rec8/ScpA/Scc1 (kleisin family)